MEDEVKGLEMDEVKGLEMDDLINDSKTERDQRSSIMDFEIDADAAVIVCQTHHRPNKKPPLPSTTTTTTTTTTKTQKQPSITYAKEG